MSSSQWSLQATGLKRIPFKQYNDYKAKNMLFQPTASLFKNLNPHSKYSLFCDKHINNWNKNVMKQYLLLLCDTL